jgi:hypothetical protein
MRASDGDPADVGDMMAMAHYNIRKAPVRTQAPPLPRFRG